MFQLVSVGAEEVSIEKCQARFTRYENDESSGLKIKLEQSNRSTRLENTKFPEKVNTSLGEESFGFRVTKSG